MDYKKLVKVADSKIEKVADSVVLYNSEDMYNEDVLREFCEDNDIPVPEEGSEEWYDIAREYDDQAWGQFFHEDLGNIDRNYGFVVTGKVGRWNGTRNIAAVAYKSIQEAINACMPSGAQSDMIISTTDDGGLQVIAKHHDGQNVFEIHALTPKGIDLYEEGNEDELGDPKYWDVLEGSSKVE